MTITVRLLRTDDDRSQFASGDVDLDRFFQRFAGQNQFRHHIGSTYVAVEGDRLVGYATVSIGHVEGEKLPKRLTKRLPSYPLPVLRLARLAIAETEQGRGVGKHLLRHVILLALQLRTDVGCVGVLVDAKAGAEAFYAKYGFVPFPILQGELRSRPRPVPVFLPIGAL